MKKLLCAILALALCLSTCALASTVPSKTTGDLTQVEATAEKVTGTETVYATTTQAAEDEVQKLMNSESVEEYFGEVKDAEGNVVDLAKVLDLQDGETLNVHDFCAFVVDGFAEDCGNVTAALTFPTVYAENEEVIVLIGLVETEAITWTAFEGVGAADGSIKVEIPQEMVQKIQNGEAVMAIVSK